MDSSELALQAFQWLQNGIVFYVAAINVIYLFLTILGYSVMRRRSPGLSPGQIAALGRSQMLPSIAIVAPAYNEALTIRESIRGLIRLNYPNFEVIVVNDGSQDDTLRILIENFRLYRSARMVSDAVPCAAVRAAYQSHEVKGLCVIDKVNGGKADASNAGINAARSDLVVVCDSDSLLEPDSLLNIVRPFLEDPKRTVAVGGIVRIINGCEVGDGRVVRVGTPASHAALFQAVEYLRAFLGGRVAFSFLNSLMLISGAFGVFRRDVLTEVGGFSTWTIGEDMELVLKLHHALCRRRQPYRIAFIAEPVCWTEVPEDLGTLRNQRRRWQRGAFEALKAHREMFLNPRYGALGLIGFPYFFFFELLGPAVEAVGYLATVAGLAFGWISQPMAVAFFVVSIVFGVVLSMSSVLLEEMTTRRYPNPRDSARLFVAALMESMGFRQMLLWWRLEGLWQALRGKRGWGGAMTRRGFTTSRTR